MGSIEEALTQFRRGLELAPDRVEAAYFLVQLTKVRAGDEALQALEAMLPRLSSLSSREQCLVQFGLAKAYDDIGERDCGSAHLLKGNATNRSHWGIGEEPPPSLPPALPATGKSADVL